MDKEQEDIQFLGFFGIFQESYKIVPSWRKIFTQISISFILPLSFMYLFHIILQNENILDNSQMDTRTYDKSEGISCSDWTKLFLFKLFYIIVFLILSLLSTSAVTYTIACIYTGREISFVKVISVVPKVWKRLIITFLWSSAIMVVYIVAGVSITLLVSSRFERLGFKMIGMGGVVLIILAIVFSVGFVYIRLISQLASVVSVMEDFYGLKAMRKSRDLIKGKMGISILVSMMFFVCATGVKQLFEALVDGNIEKTILYRISLGVFCLSLKTVLMLLLFIVQTIIYFICKSFHHENIDKSLLSDHLQVYLGDYAPLKASDVQLEQCQVYQLWLKTRMICNGQVICLIYE